MADTTTKDFRFAVPVTKETAQIWRALMRADLNARAQNTALKMEHFVKNLQNAMYSSVRPESIREVNLGTREDPAFLVQDFTVGRVMRSVQDISKALNIQNADLHELGFALNAWVIDQVRSNTVVPMKDFRKRVDDYLRSIHASVTCSDPRAFLFRTLASKAEISSLVKMFGIATPQHLGLPVNLEPFEVYEINYEFLFERLGSGAADSDHPNLWKTFSLDLRRLHDNFTLSNSARNPDKDTGTARAADAVNPFANRTIHNLDEVILKIDKVIEEETGVKETA